MPSTGPLVNNNIAGDNNYIMLQDANGAQLKLTASGGVLVISGGSITGPILPAGYTPTEITGDTSAYAEATLKLVIDALVAAGLATDSTTT